jgi:undecaprenyl-diphosphatase
MAAAFFVAFAYIFAPKIQSWVRRESLIAFCAMSIIAVGASRVIINVHWASDVIAGWALGVFLATGSILLIRYVGGLFIKKENV